MGPRAGTLVLTPHPTSDIVKHRRMPATSHGPRSVGLAATAMSEAAEREASLLKVALAVMSFGGGVADTCTNIHGPFTKAEEVSPRKGPSIIILAWAGTWRISSSILSAKDCVGINGHGRMTEPAVIMAVMVVHTVTIPSRGINRATPVHLTTTAEVAVPLASRRVLRRLGRATRITIGSDAEDVPAIVIGSRQVPQGVGPTASPPWPRQSSRQGILSTEDCGKPADWRQYAM